MTHSTRSTSPSHDTYELDDGLLKYAFKQSPIGFWQWDIKSDTVYGTDRFKAILGLDDDFILTSEEWFKLVHPEDLKRVETHLEEHLANKHAFHIDFRLRHADGHWIWINSDAEVSFDEYGTANKMNGSISNIDEAVALRQSTARSEAELRLIFDHVPANIWFKDAHNKIIRLNEKAAISMNMRVEDAEGADTYDLFPDMAKKYHEDDLDVINSGVARIGIIEEFTPSEGQRGWVQTDKIPYHNIETDEKFVFVVSKDVTEELENRRELELYAQRLELVNKELDHFAYVASHDLKAPLRGMDNITQWIEEDIGEALTPDIKNKLDLLRSRVHRMEQLLKDILAFSRAGKDNLQKENLNLTEVVTHVAEWITLPEKFSLQISPDLPDMETSRSLMEHIFLNLISNAVKHNEKENGFITISHIDHKEYYEFIVQDNGQGIAPEYHDQVFQIFKKLQSKDKVEGSGIGLAIVKKMVQALNGSIWILSDENHNGTAFHFTLPKTT